MLYENPPFYMIDGVSIMPDHADPRQFYYMPLAPEFVTIEEGAIDVPRLSIIKFRSAASNGGFLDFDVHLGMDEERLRDIESELQRLAQLRDRPFLSPIPVVDGAVRMMLFGSETGAASGFVRSIRHAAKPALYGDQRAAFSVELDERGITILDQAMRKEMAPIGIIYSLDYLALRPGYHVRLEVDWDRLQDFMDTTYGHEGLFDSVQIQDTVEKLEEQCIVTITGDLFVTEEEAGSLAERRDAALARVRDMVTDAFFESSLDPQREAPDGWDKARDVIKSFSPQRFAPAGVFSYKKTHYTRIDKKRLDVDFSERITIKRTISPQGHLSGLFRKLEAGLDLSRLIASVDADDPWFQRRKVRVISRADFDKDPVRSLTATLTYGTDTKTVLLDKARPEQEVQWPSIVTQGSMLGPVQGRFSLDLLPGEAGERPHHLESQPFEILGESQGLEPRDLFSLETIPVLTLPNFSFDRFPQVDVQLRYDDPANAIRQDDLLRITKDAPSLNWQRFLVGAPAGPVMVKFTYRAADHRDHGTPFVPLDRPQVDVADPFPRRLKVTIVPALNFATVDRAFVDLDYRDDANGIRFEDSIEIVQDQPPRPFLVDRVDPLQARVRYRITILMQDGSVFEGPWSTTVGSRIFVRPDLKGHRAVTLRAPADFGALERIELDALAKDEIGGLTFADRFTFASPGETVVFEYDFLDPANDSFTLDVHRLFKNGLSTRTTGLRIDQDDLTLTAS